MPVPTSSSTVPGREAPRGPWYPAPVQVSRDGDGEGGQRPSPTEPVPTFEPGELFPDSWDGDGERTVVAALPFEIKPRFTGRRAIVEKLAARFATAVEQRELAFVAIIAEPGMGKSRLVAEVGR